MAATNRGGGGAAAQNEHQIRRGRQHMRTCAFPCQRAHTHTHDQAWCTCLPSAHATPPPRFESPRPDQAHLAVAVALVGAAGAVFAAGVAARLADRERGKAGCAGRPVAAVALLPAPVAGAPCVALLALVLCLGCSAFAASPCALLALGNLGLLPQGNPAVEGYTSPRTAPTLLKAWPGPAHAHTTTGALVLPTPPCASSPGRPWAHLRSSS